MLFDLKKILSSLGTQVAEKPTKIVGIDLGSSSVKLVELELLDEVITLATYGELQLGPYAEMEMGSSVKLTTEKKIEAIVDVIRESGVGAKNGVFALSLASSFVTVMPLTAKEGEDISPRVHVEARKYIPVPITDVVLEWTEIVHPQEENPLTREVLLVAIQNDALADTKSILDSIGMKSHPSEIELFSSLRAVTKDSDDSVAVIDLGASMSKLYIAEDRFLQRIHRVQAGGAHATKAIAQKLSLSFEDAENLKRNYTPTHEHSLLIKKVMESTFDRAFQEFKRVIAQYELRSGTTVSRIVLTGGSATFPGMQLFAQYAFDREVEVTNPFTKVAYPAFMEDTLKEIAPTFSVALGAALRHFE